MKLATLAGLALASMSLCACAGMSLPLTGNPTADAKTAVSNLSAVNANLGAINQQVLTAMLLACGSHVDVSVGFPAPVPQGKIDFNCNIAPGQLSLVDGKVVANPIPAPGAPLSPAAIGTPASVAPPAK